MTKTLQPAIDILSKLVAFKSVSGNPTHDIVAYITEYLDKHGVESTVSFDDARERANVFATIGPEIDGGLILSGHTDVVPVDGQEWSTDPFCLTQIDQCLYGRGSVDMKGFLACILASVPVFQSSQLQKPIHIAFSFDEETGGFGMPYLLNSIAQLPFRPAMVIVGEPTDMQLITAHKGAFEMRTEITGHAVHACNPTLGTNAIVAATKLITKIEEIAARMASNPMTNTPFEPPYCTFNVGIIEGGTASNATAGWCHFNWEFRSMPGEDGQKIVDEVVAFSQKEILPAMKQISPDANIDIITLAPVPALDDRNADLAAEFVSQITGLNSRDVVSFGTDGGYFSNDGLSTVVIGPGDINRAHKADEYIEIKELEQGLAFLKKAAQRLSA